jgi:hypothetical protein
VSLSLSNSAAAVTALPLLAILLKNPHANSTGQAQKLLKETDIPENCVVITGNMTSFKILFLLSS